MLFSGKDNGLGTDSTQLGINLIFQASLIQTVKPFESSDVPEALP